MGLWHAMILVFWKLSFKPTFSLSSFTFIKRLFSSLFSAVRVVSSAYLRLLIFLPAILVPACASSSLAFLMMYSSYKLNKQVTIYSLDVLLSQFVTSLLFHVQFSYSWPAYTFLRRQDSMPRETTSEIWKELRVGGQEASGSWHRAIGPHALLLCHRMKDLYLSLQGTDIAVGHISYDEHT